MKLPTLLECDCLVQVKEMYSLFMHKFMTFYGISTSVDLFCCDPKKEVQINAFCMLMSVLSRSHSSDVHSESGKAEVQSPC